MKKLLLLLAFITLGLNFNAQSNLDSAALITYQIDTLGSSDGLVIPSGFYISITGFNLQKDGGYYYVATIQTYLNTEEVRNIKNDSFKNGKRFYIEPSDLTISPILIFRNTVKAYLDNIYGADNVTKLN